MGLGEALGDLWHRWTDTVPAVLLVVLLAALLLAWIVSGTAVQAVARRRLANTYGWTVATLVPAVAIAAAGLSTPRSFPFWLLGALVATPLAALANRALLERGAASCPAGHPMAAAWVYCPRCAPPPPDLGRRPLVGATAVPGPAAPLGGAVRPAWARANPTVGAFPNGGGRSGPAEATGEVMLWLVPDSRPELGERVVRKPGGTIGRDPASDIVLDDAGVSWNHARIVERAGSPSIVDLGSRNGTYVNDERVETSLLISGDRLTVGDTVFRVVRP